MDEIVGGLKVQLAPKTNFWSNSAGAENVANAVIDLLAPSPKTTVLEIGCGIGLIGLMMASVNKKNIFIINYHIFILNFMIFNFRNVNKL